MARFYRLRTEERFPIFKTKNWDVVFWFLFEVFSVSTGPIAREIRPPTLLFFLFLSLHFVSNFSN